MDPSYLLLVAAPVTILGGIWGLAEMSVRRENQQKQRAKMLVSQLDRDLAAMSSVELLPNHTKLGKLAEGHFKRAGELRREVMKMLADSRPNSAIRFAELAALEIQSFWSVVGMTPDDALLALETTKAGCFGYEKVEQKDQG